MNNIYLRHAYPNELYHHGILGQKWGIRRFQNKDGSLTPTGKKRYGIVSVQKTNDAINNMMTPDVKNRLSTALSRMAKDPASEMKVHRDVYNSLTRDEQLDLIRQDPTASKKYYDKIDEVINNSKKETKIQRAESAVGELKTIGFKDDNAKDPESHWLSKRIKTKHGDVEFFTNIDTGEFGVNGGTGEFPITAKDVRTSVAGVNKYGKSVVQRLNKELKDGIAKGYWDGANVKLGQIDTAYMVKFRDIGSPSCEVSVPVKDKSTNQTYGWLSVEMDPVTGKLENVSYND